MDKFDRLIRSYLGWYWYW